MAEEQASLPPDRENFFDVAHLGIVHAWLLGDPQRVRMEEYEVAMGAHGPKASDIRIWQPDPDGTGQSALVNYRYWACGPLTAAPDLFLIVGLAPLCSLPVEFVVSRILPGVAVSVLAGNLFYAWQARRLAVAVCAVFERNHWGVGAILRANSPLQDSSIYEA
jgi:hypothetical protein